MMNRHKKYTSLVRSDPLFNGGEGQNPGNSQLLPNCYVPVPEYNTLQLQELGTTEVKDDPDFPLELRTLHTLSDNCEQQRHHDQQPSINGVSDNHISFGPGISSNGPIIIKPEPLSPRRPVMDTVSFTPPVFSGCNSQGDQQDQWVARNIIPNYSASACVNPIQISAQLSTQTGLNSDGVSRVRTGIIEVEPQPHPSMITMDPQPGTSGNENTQPFRIQSDLIAAVPTNKQADELQDLGLTVFNADEFEQGVMAQVDKALAVQEHERAKKIAEKEMKTIQDGLRAAKQELQSTEKIISMLTSPGGMNKEVSRRLKTVNQHRDNKLKQMKNLKARLRTVTLKVNGSLDGLDDDCLPQEGEEGPSALEQALGMSSTETEYERMIRLGEMTPFGTVMPCNDPTRIQPNPPKPPPPKPRQLKTDTSDFDNYLRDQQKKSVKRIKEKRPVLKRSSNEISITSRKDNIPVKHKKRKKEKEKTCKGKQSRKSTSKPTIVPSDESTDNIPAFDPLISGTIKLGEGNIFDAKDHRNYRPSEADFSSVKSRRRKFPNLEHNFSEDRDPSDIEIGDENQDEDLSPADDKYRPDVDEESSQDDEYQEDEDLELEKQSRKTQGKKPFFYAGEDEIGNKHGVKKKGRTGVACRAAKDDGTLAAYEKRLKSVAQEQLKKKEHRLALGQEDSDSESDMEFEGGFKVPGQIWNKLYRYQKTGVRWLWELHGQQAGGIVGDEMGLGKTIQIIAFLAGLKHSKLRDKGDNRRYSGLGPTLIVTPATVLHQWVKEFHTWWPQFRVAVLHASGSFTSSVEGLIHSIVRSNSVLITAFSSVVIHQEALLKYDWHYVILDEGHKIRNPDAQVTVACKMFRTCHRLILSGSPMQNNLKELWSLFDFVFPGKLGTLPDFMAHFSVPIVQGGYSNATQVQVQTAYKCACVLRDTINPYLLRRMKSDVKESLQLPDKNEQVLFCRLTDHQREIYKEYIDSRECQQILNGNFMVFPGLITLRKICNHPDLSTGGPKVFDPDLINSGDKSLEYGYHKRAGKLIVVQSLLRLWHKQGSKVLLFSQSRQMLDILESFVESEGYTHLRMDGGTTIASRQPLIQRYNQDASIFVFLLTTRVGGLGVNLIGANKIIIYDPDWNPSTDTQARERSWRIGQKRQVTIYRLLTTGTIEEKIYHRQIFKQFLTNRVLKDPKQRRFFKSNDLFDLFTLGEDNPGDGTETSAIFAGTGSDVRVKIRNKSKIKISKDVHKTKNRFDALREKEQELGFEREDWSEEIEGSPDASSEIVDKEQNTVSDVSIGNNSSAIQLSIKIEDNTSPNETSNVPLGSPNSREETNEKLAKMRELAKKLSQKITGSNTNSTDSAHSNQTGKEYGNKSIPLKQTESSEKGKSSKNHKSKRSKHKKDKKKKKKNAELEGEKISHLDRHGAFQKRDKEEDETKKTDDYVLGKLLKKKGVHSALQHDKIMMSSDPDFALVEGEAERVAKEAARALKRSRAQCMNASSGVPTWTGHSGGTATASSRPRFGRKKNPKLVSETVTEPSNKSNLQTQLKEQSSKSGHFDGSVAGNMKTSGAPGTSGKTVPNMMSSGELLMRMKSRNQMTQAANQVEDDNEDYGNVTAVSQTGLSPDDMELMTDIRNAIAFGSHVDGQASTQELLDQFASRVKAHESAKFKAMLQNICDFGRRDGVGVWRLKPEFR